eukprot:gene8787-18174_t
MDLVGVANPQSPNHIVMGLCTSQYKLVDEPEIKEWIPLTRAIKLNDDEVKLFFKLWNKLLGRNRPPLEVKEFLQHFYLDTHNAYIFKLFTVFKSNQNNKRTFDNFKEFCFGLWNFCTFSEDALSISIITAAEVMQFVKDSYGLGGMFRKECISVLTEVEKYFGKVGMRKEMFVTFLKQHPQLIFHVIQAQKKLSIAAFGSNKWKTFYSSRGIMIEDDIINNIFLRACPYVLDGTTGVTVETMMIDENLEKEKNLLKRTESESKRIRKSSLSTSTIHHSPTTDDPVSSHITTTSNNSNNNKGTSVVRFRTRNGSITPVTDNANVNETETATYNNNNNANNNNNNSNTRTSITSNQISFNSPQPAAAARATAASNASRRRHSLNDNSVLPDIMAYYDNNNVETKKDDKDHRSIKKGGDGRGGGGSGSGGGGRRRSMSSVVGTGGGDTAGGGGLGTSTVGTTGWKGLNLNSDGASAMQTMEYEPYVEELARPQRRRSSGPNEEIFRIAKRITRDTGQTVVTAVGGGQPTDSEFPSEALDGTNELRPTNISEPRKIGWTRLNDRKRLKHIQSDYRLQMTSNGHIAQRKNTNNQPPKCAQQNLYVKGIRVRLATLVDVDITHRVHGGITLGVVCEIKSSHELESHRKAQMCSLGAILTCPLHCPWTQRIKYYLHGTHNLEHMTLVPAIAIKCEIQTVGLIVTDHLRLLAFCAPKQYHIREAAKLHQFILQYAYSQFAQTM